MDGPPKLNRRSNSIDLQPDYRYIHVLSRNVCGQGSILQIDGFQPEKSDQYEVSISLAKTICRTSAPEEEIWGSQEQYYKATFEYCTLVSAEAEAFKTPHPVFFRLDCQILIGYLMQILNYRYGLAMVKSFSDLSFDPDDIAQHVLSGLRFNGEACIHRDMIKVQ